MEGKCCWVQFSICGFGAVTADFGIPPVWVLFPLSVFLDDDSLNSGIPALHMFAFIIHFLSLILLLQQEYTKFYKMLITHKNLGITRAFF